MRLVACPRCHAQYDASGLQEPWFECRCGETVRDEGHAAVDAAVQRCGACGALLAEGAERCDYCRSAVVRDGTSLDLICPECYASNAESSRFCTACGVEFRPQPLPSEQGDPVACPCCHVELAFRGIGGVWVQECPKCRGLWVPGDRFGRLVERAIEARRARAAEGLPAGGELAPRRVDGHLVYRSCPVCGARMYRKNFAQRSGVIVDWCGPHGTWLDADELEHIAAFVMAGGMAAGTAGGTPGLSHGAPLSVEQFQVMAEADRAREAARARFEPSGSHFSLVDLLFDLLN